MKEIYHFAIPIEISYCVDETNLLIETVKDIKKLEKDYDVDLDFVIDEYEYKIQIEEQSMSDDEEYMGLTKSEIFDSVITDLWDEILEQLNTDVKLFNLDDKIVNKIFHLTSDSFNTGNLQQYYNKDKDFDIISMTMNNFNKIESVFYVDVTVDKKLNDKQIEDIRKYIDGQCSDGWGEGFEQQDKSIDLDEEDRYVYIKTWNTDTEVKFIK